MSTATLPAEKTFLAQVGALADRFVASLGEPAPAFPSEEFSLLAEFGVLAAPLPEDEGGLGWGIEPGKYGQSLQLLREVGRANLAVGRIFEGHVNALQLIHVYGTSEQFLKAAADVRDQNCIFGVWNTEPQNGVRFTQDGAIQMHGKKSFASGAGYIQRAIVTGKLPKQGWQMSIVALDRVQLEIDKSSWQPIGMEATASYHVDFSNVRLDRNELLGEPDDYYRNPLFLGGAIRFAAVQLGAAESLLNLLRQFLIETKRVDDPYQLARIGEIAIAVESGRQWVLQAGDHFNRWRTDGDRMMSFANMTRIAIQEICLKTIDLTERCIGARGLLAPYSFARILRDLQMYLRQAGPDKALASVGQHILAERI